MRVAVHIAIAALLVSGCSTINDLLDQNKVDYKSASGIDANGDTKVELFPTPNSSCALIFHLVIPQATLTTGSTVISAPFDPIILGAYAMALVERGEDQGLTSSEATTLYRIALADPIAIESGRFCENEVWRAT